MPYVPKPLADFKGFTRLRNGTIIVRVMVRGARYYLGTYPDEATAKQAYTNFKNLQKALLP